MMRVSLCKTLQQYRARHSVVERLLGNLASLVGESVNLSKDRKVEANPKRIGGRKVEDATAAW
jgi:hypothetical protein